MECRIEQLLVRRGLGADAFSLWIPDVRIGPGQVTGVVGPSGSGKSTFLDLLALALAPEPGGRFIIDLGPDGQLDASSAPSEQSVDQYRRAHLGYVLQTATPVPFLSVRENIALPLRRQGLEVADRVALAAERVGITHLLERKPAHLSVGERQRAMLARAMIHTPGLIIADEPTAALDGPNARTAIELLQAAAAEGAAVVIVSHDTDLLAACGVTCATLDRSGPEARLIWPV